MYSFKKNNSDKINLASDAKVMSEAVGVEQELIRVKQDNRELKFNIRENHLSYQTQIINLTKRAKAWDDLEALVANRKISIRMDDDGGMYFYKGSIFPFIHGKFSIDIVSNALESIKGES